MMDHPQATLSVEEAHALVVKACTACGANPASSKSLADATLSAARFGQPTMGFPHLLDYLESQLEGRINGNAQPIIRQPLPAVMQVDAQGGIAQLGFDLAFEELASRASTYGIALFTQKNSYTTGELGYYVRRLASAGLVSVAATNGPALMAANPGGQRVYCTNPIAFGSPVAGSPAPLVIDQASSATAFVNIVRAANDGREIPADWAVDANGEPTSDPKAAILGALLPVGGFKGANIALMVEVLAAGLSGADWSLEVKDFRAGDQCPNAGLTIIALSPDLLDVDFNHRLAEQVDRLKGLGVRVPGLTRSQVETQFVELEEQTLTRLRAYA